MKHKIKDIWKYFKGKKRNLGILAGFVLRGVTVFSNVLTVDQSQFIGMGIDIFLLGGLADNLSRTKTAKNIVQKANKLIKK